jgi:hypothetical protein
MIETRIKTVKTVIRIYRHNILDGTCLPDRQVNPVEKDKNLGC